jgi:putative sterol carrier protein
MAGRYIDKSYYEKLSNTKLGVKLITFWVRISYIATATIFLVDMNSLIETAQALVQKAMLSPAVQQKIKGWNKVFQLKPTDSEPFFVKIVDDRVTVEKGVYPNPVATVIMSSQDMLDMFQGNLNPTQAFFSGKLKVEGNLFEAQSLQTVLGSA